MNQHAKTLLTALVNDETIEHLYNCKWEAVSTNQVLGNIVHYPMERLQRLLRVKPKTININGHEVPEPMRVAPEFGSTYWIPNLCGLLAAAEDTWTDHSIDRRSLSNGICHTTKEAAQAHFNALLSFTKVP